MSSAGGYISLSATRLEDVRGQAELDLRATFTGSLAVDQAAPSEFELTRAGRRYSLGFLAVTGIAPVQAIPTTAAQWFFYNAHASRSCAIGEIGAVLVSGTAAAGILVLAGLTGPGSNPATIPTASTTVFGGQQNRALATARGSLIVAASQTLAAAPPNGWVTMAKSDSAATGILSVAAINYNVSGRMIIPPGGGLAINVTSGVGTTPLFAPHLTWSELDVQLDY